MLPPEIRNQIFSLALLQYEDLSEPYADYDYCYRPGHRARRRVSTGLLETCRRVWLEANHWPMAQAVHTFWYAGERRPDWFVGRWGWDDEFFKSLSSLQRPRVKHIHVLAQMWWLENELATSPIWKGLRRESLRLDSFTITIRHSDWWNWEQDERLHLERRWVRKLLASPEATRISEFRLELETLEWKVNQLRPIVDKLRLVGEPKNGAVARWELAEPFEESTWSGPVNLGADEHAIYKDRGKLDYRVITMKWRLRVATDIEQRWREEGSLLKLCQPSDSRIHDQSSSEDEMSDDEMSGDED